MLFLNLYIRRSHLLIDSLAEVKSDALSIERRGSSGFFIIQVTKKREDLKKKLRVTFVGEHGLDMGGLTKEWFLLLLREIFRPDYGSTTKLRSSSSSVETAKIFFFRNVCLL